MSECYEDPIPRDDGRFRGKLGYYALNVLGITSGRETHFIFTPDDRRLAVQVSGREGGKTAYLFHGSPGSRFDPSLEASMLWHMGVQIVTYDRPGYGKSDPRTGNRPRPVDAVDDVKRIADHLSLWPDYVIGRSGGAPYALACAARLSVQKAAVLVPLGPRKLMGDALWYEGMAPFNVEAFEAGEHDPVKLDNMLTRERAKILGLKPEDGEFDPGFTDGDRGLLLSKLKNWIGRSHQSGLREGIAGWRADVVGTADWGFDPRTIDVSTLIWGAGKDVFTPSQHYKWLADNIPTAELHTEASASHTRAMEVLPGVVGWCINGEYFSPVSVY